MLSCAQNEQLQTGEFKSSYFRPDKLNGNLTISLADTSSKRPLYKVLYANRSWEIPVVIDPYKYAGKPNNPDKLQIDYDQIVSKSNAIIALNESAGGEDIVSCLLSIKENKAELFVIKRGFRPASKYKDTQEYWYTWQVSSFSSNGVFMENNTVFYKWNDLQVQHVGTYLF